MPNHNDDDTGNDVVQELRKLLGPDKPHGTFLNRATQFGQSPAADEAENAPNQVLVACHDWAQAIAEHNVLAASEASQRLYGYLKPMEHRPSIAQAIQRFLLAHPDDPKNLPVIASVVKFIRQW